MSVPPAFSIVPGSLRDRAVVAEPFDSVNGFRTAASRRWEDGMALVGGNDTQTAAIYLLGYSAELALKVAVCELLGVSLTGDPWAWVVSNKAKLGLHLKDVRTHDLRDLWEQASDRREGLGLDLRDPAFHGALQYHSWRVYTHWWEELRYKNVVAIDSEVLEVAESSLWLVANIQEIYK